MSTIAQLRQALTDQRISYGELAEIEDLAVEAGITVTDEMMADDVLDAIEESRTTHRMPRNSSEAKAALSMKRATGEQRRVSWHYFKARPKTSDHYLINVNPANTLHISVYSGLPFLEVESGHVTVVFQSDWGNSLAIHPGASAHVIVPSAATKVTIRGDETNLTMDLPEGKHRVYYPSKYPERASLLETLRLEQEGK